MYKLDLERVEEPEIKLPISIGSYKKQGNSRKTSASVTTGKPLIMYFTTNCGKFLKRWKYQTTLLKKLYVGQQATEPDIEQQTGEKLRKDYI